MTKLAAIDREKLKALIIPLMQTPKPKNAKKLKVTTPVGIAVYPHLLKPDEYLVKKENKEQCNTGLRLDPSVAEHKAFIDEVSAYVEVSHEVGIEMLKAQLPEAKGKKLADLKKAIEETVPHYPFEPEYDDDGEETGLVRFSAKTQVAGVDKKTNQRWEREVAIYDSAGQPVKGKARAGMRLWGGSEIAISAEVVPFCAEGLKKAGVSLRILAVQVVSMPQGGGSATDHGFGVEGGGFRADTFESHGDDPADDAPPANAAEGNDDF